MFERFTAAMFERFTAAFQLTPPDQAPGPVWRDARLLRAGGYRELAERFAGCTFDNGLYRLHDATSGPQALELAGEAFPEFATRIRPFGYDWYGRQFALDAGRTEAGEPLVLLLEPATGEALEVPHPLVRFHEEELVDYRDEVLAASFFTEWSRANASALPLPRNQCVGPKVPLFLGGSDEVSELEVSDIDVYWSLSGQLRLATRDLPDGTSIRSASIED